MENQEKRRKGASGDLGKQLFISVHFHLGFHPRAVRTPESVFQGC